MSRRDRPHTPKPTAAPQPAAAPDGDPDPDACRNCRFWRFAGQTDDRGVPVGHCRRYPAAGPVKAVTPIGPLMALPVKPAGEWCGEHQRA